MLKEIHTELWVLILSSLPNFYYCVFNNVNKNFRNIFKHKKKQIKCDDGVNISNYNNLSMLKWFVYVGYKPTWKCYCRCDNNINIIKWLQSIQCEYNQLVFRHYLENNNIDILELLTCWYDIPEDIIYYCIEVSNIHTLKWLVKVCNIKLDMLYYDINLYFDNEIVDYCEKIQLMESNKLL